jgi:hypothetical protein
MATAVFGLCATDLSGHLLVTYLLDDNFLSETISVVYPTSNVTRSRLQTAESTPPTSPASNAEAAVEPTGGALAWLPGLTQVAIQGVGTLCVAGPFLAAAKAAVGDIPARGLSDLLVSLGIPESEVRRYEGKLRAGRFLVSVIAGDEDRADDAAELFAEAGAEDIVFSSDGDAPAPWPLPRRGSTSAPYPHDQDIRSRT